MSPLCSHTRGHTHRCPVHTRSCLHMEKGQSNIAQANSTTWKSLCYTTLRVFKEAQWIQRTQRAQWGREVCPYSRGCHLWKSLNGQVTLGIEALLVLLCTEVALFQRFPYIRKSCIWDSRTKAGVTVGREEEALRTCTLVRAREVLTPVWADTLCTLVDIW